jgi:hypothetical protein
MFDYLGAVRMFPIKQSAALVLLLLGLLTGSTPGSSRAPLPSLLLR